MEVIETEQTGKVLLVENGPFGSSHRCSRLRLYPDWGMTQSTVLLLDMRAMQMWVALGRTPEALKGGSFSFFHAFVHICVVCTLRVGTG